MSEKGTIGMLQGLMLVHRILSYALYSTGIRYNVRVFESEMTMKPSSRDLLVIMKNLQYSEWFFLQCLATNLDGKQSVALLRAMADNYQPVGHMDDDSTPLKQDTASFSYEKVPTLALKKWGMHSHSQISKSAWEKVEISQRSAGSDELNIP